MLPHRSELKCGLRSFHTTPPPLKQCTNIFMNLPKDVDTAVVTTDNTDTDRIFLEGFYGATRIISKQENKRVTKIVSKLLLEQTFLVEILNMQNSPPAGLQSAFEKLNAINEMLEMAISAMSCCTVEEMDVLNDANFVAVAPNYAAPAATPNSPLPNSPDPAAYQSDISLISSPGGHLSDDTSSSLSSDGGSPGDSTTELHNTLQTMAAHQSEMEHRCSEMEQKHLKDMQEMKERVAAEWEREQQKVRMDHQNEMQEFKKEVTQDMQEMENALKIEMKKEIATLTEQLQQYRSTTATTTTASTSTT